MIIDQFRIYLTENCNANCPFCFNVNTRKNTEMDIDKFKILCDFLSKNGVIELKFMGGEPTVHSKFSECWYIAQQYFKFCSLFTNGLNHNALSRIILRETDSVIYNYKFITNTDKDYLFANSNLQSFRRFEVLLQPNDDPNKICDKIQKTVDICNKYRFSQIRFNPTLDCTINIFENEEIFQKSNIILNKVLHFLIQNNIPLRIDHSYPFCCLSEQNINLIKSANINISFLCGGSTGCFGLINSNFDIVHCNQYQNNKLQLFDKDNIILSMNDIKKWLILQNQQKYNNLLETKCIDCVLFNNVCDGGCLGHKFKDRYNILDFYR